MTWNLDRRKVAILNQKKTWQPTTPHPNLLNRAPEDYDVVRLLETLSDGVDELVAYGTNVLVWCGSDVKEVERDKVVPALLLFRHVLDLLDSVAVLLRVGSVDACEIQLRAALEGEFGLEYLLLDDTGRRGTAYIVAYYDSQLRKLEGLDPASEKGRRTRKDAADDKTLASAGFLDVPGREEAAAEVREILSRPRFREVYAEYVRTKKERNRKHWYSVYDGPGNLEELAAAIKRPMLYESFYRDFSVRAHGLGVFDGRVEPTERGSSIVQLRFPVGAEYVTFFAITVGLNTFQAMLERFVPGRLQEFAHWYVGLREFYLTVANGGIFRRAKG